VISPLTVIKRLTRGYSILFENVQSNGEIRLVNRASYFLSEDFVGDESTLLNSPALVEVLTKQS